MNDYLLWVKIKTRPFGLHRVRGRDVFVILATSFVVGLPLLFVGKALISDTGKLTALMMSRFPHTSADAIGLGGVAVYGLLLWLAMWIGGRILHRYLS